MQQPCPPATRRKRGRLGLADRRKAALCNGSSNLSRLATGSADPRLLHGTMGRLWPLRRRHGFTPDDPDTFTWNVRFCRSLSFALRGGWQPGSRVKLPDVGLLACNCGCATELKFGGLGGFRRSRGDVECGSICPVCRVLRPVAATRKEAIGGRRFCALRGNFVQALALGRTCRYIAGTCNNALVR